jgi:hypothetical protein
MAYLTLPDPETINFMIQIAELASMKTLIDTNQIKPYLSLREAQRKYGTAIVNRWLKEDLIQKRKDGNGSSKIRIDRIQIEAVSKACNRATYITTKER